VSNAANIALWGNPEPESAFLHNLTTVPFLGHQVTVHRKAAAAFRAVDADIRAAGITYNFYDVQTYCHRYIRGKYYEDRKIWSNHAFGVAVDINPDENPMRDDGVLQTDIPAEVIAIFKRHGFRWLGESKSRRKDAMHFELMQPAAEEEEELNELQDTLLKLIHVSMIAQSNDQEIQIAIAEGNLVEAKRLMAEAKDKALAKKAQYKV
jgi:hypothetical protein